MICFLTECDLQYYGPNCSLECSPHCADGCDNETGICYSCIEGKFLESCTKACGAGCVFGCDRYTGTCTCKLGWRGNGCDGKLSKYSYTNRGYQNSHVRTKMCFINFPIAEKKTSSNQNLQKICFYK